MLIRKRTSEQTLNALEQYISGLGDEPIRLVERELLSWGELSYAELEQLIEEGRLNEYLNWQEKYARLINEVLSPMWTVAAINAAARATRGKIKLSDSDEDVKAWLRSRGGELITNQSVATRRAISNILIDWQARQLQPRTMSQQIRPLIGLTERQMRLVERYREKVFETLTGNGMRPSQAAQRAYKASLSYASKQHRRRAETILHTELAFAYNRGADIGVRRAISQGLMPRCELVWRTAGTNRVCARCLELKDKVIGTTDESVQLPPLHPRCRCTIIYEETGTAIEMPRRRRAQDGHEIIDKPTYSKLTRSFEKAGGLIIRGEEAAKHLAQTKASASYFAGANVAFITDDATISDVLEEMYHARQDRTKMFGEIGEPLVWLKREIDAQKYLLGIADKYKIPLEELEVTRENLRRYEKQLEEALNGK